jgi:hypothetical protein
MIVQQGGAVRRQDHRRRVWLVAVVEFVRPLTLLAVRRHGRPQGDLDLEERLKLPSKLSSRGEVFCINARLFNNPVQVRMR